jgi:hypothetical protein
MVAPIDRLSRLSCLIRGALCFGLLLALSFSSPAIAADTPPLLTLDQFKARLRQPINGDGGTQMIDLRRFTLDLRPDSDLGNDFYPKLHQTLQESKQPLGIDLSDSTILGDLNGSQIGLTTSPSLEAQLTPT